TAWVSELVTSPSWYIPGYEPLCLVDMVCIECTSDTEINVFQGSTPPFTMPFDAVNHEFSYNVEVPKGAVVTSAELTLEGKYEIVPELYPAEPIQLTYAGQDSNPDIYGDWVVFQRESSSFDIYILDIGDDSDQDGYPDAVENPSTLTVTDLTATSTHNEMNPRIYKNMVVYQSDIDGNWNIYLQILDVLGEPDGSPICIADHSDDEVNPDIYGDWVVYERHEDHTDEIWGFYLPSLGDQDTNMRLTYDYRDTGLYDKTNPVIYGQRVLWQDDFHTASNYDIFMLELNDFWTKTFQDEVMNPDIETFSKIIGEYSAEQNSDIYGLGNVVGVATTTTSEFEPDIHGSKVVWSQMDIIAAQLDENVYICDLSMGFDARPLSLVLGFATGIEDKHPRITGNSVVWTSVIDELQEIVLYDLNLDSDRDFCPNYLEPIPVDFDPAREVVASMMGGVGFDVRVAVFGDHVIWTYQDHNLLATLQDIGLCIGKAAWDDDDRAWSRSELFLQPGGTDNLAGEINEYLSTYTGPSDPVPVKFIFHSDTEVGLEVLSIKIVIEFPTNVMESDTDRDFVGDG
ncbi:MAG: hypothetical protein KAX31_06030, partial [Thermoplasmata archaeon]|nr:hypothetical protein [Thermoplasmata archaeon]